MYGMYVYSKVAEVNYNQCKDKFNQYKLLDIYCHPYIIDLNLLLSSKMDISYAKGPFIMGMFYTRRCHSKWVHFQIHFDIGVAPPPGI